jgi:hypothetical protein
MCIPKAFYFNKKYQPRQPESTRDTSCKYLSFNINIIPVRTPSTFVRAIGHSLMFQFFSILSKFVGKVL